jgi:hypothetical protein
MTRARKKIQPSIQTSMIVAAVARLKRNAAWKDKPSNAGYFARALNLATQRKPDHRLECPA